MSLHGDAVRTLRAWQPPDADQARWRDHYLRHLDSHGDAMWRQCRPDHLTASALVVTKDRSRTLLTLHRRVGRWLQLGGHCEPGDQTLAAAALREATEESGIAGLRLDEPPARLSFHRVACGPTGPAHHLDVQYVAVAPAGAEPVLSEESADLRWFDIDALPADADHAVRALVRRACLTAAGRPTASG